MTKLLEAGTFTRPKLGEIEGTEMRLVPVAMGQAIKPLYEKIDLLVRRTFGHSSGAYRHSVADTGSTMG